MTLLSKKDDTSKTVTSPTGRLLCAEDRRTAKAAKTTRKARATKTQFSDPEMTDDKRKLRGKPKSVTYAQLKHIVTSSYGQCFPTDNVVENGGQNSDPAADSGTEPPQGTSPGV